MRSFYFITLLFIILTGGTFDSGFHPGSQRRQRPHSGGFCAETYKFGSFTEARGGQLRQLDNGFFTEARGDIMAVSFCLITYVVRGDWRIDEFPINTFCRTTSTYRRGEGDEPRQSPQWQMLQTQPEEVRASAPSGLRASEPPGVRAWALLLFKRC